MKKVIIAVSLALAASSACVKAMPTEQDMEVCQNWKGLATGVMNHRQMGASVEQTLEWVKKHDKAAHEWGYEIAMASFETPVLGSGSPLDGLSPLQKKTVSDFADFVMVTCLDVRASGSNK